jgi:formamidopyrimidine-DNA glycosylase
MPELAEVEYYRKQWNPGFGQPVISVKLHPEKRIFRKTDTESLQRTLTGAKLLSSEARGKQMLFRFSRGWVGLHLGMTGKLGLETADFQPGKHDHLVLYQRERSLVFTDPRVFGRVLFHRGSNAPEWWSRLPPDVVSSEFTAAVVAGALRKHRRAPIKAVLLNQARFPGLGNWMVDEVLWRAGIDPRIITERLHDGMAKTLWQEIRFVCRVAMEKVGADLSDPPKSWLFHQRWSSKGVCPKHGLSLKREPVAGRTTAWCPQCQPARGKAAQSKR